MIWEDFEDYDFYEAVHVNYSIACPPCPIKPKPIEVRHAKFPNIILWNLSFCNLLSSEHRHPEIIDRITHQASQEFKVDIRVMKDKPVMVTGFKTKGLRAYGKLYEIERHAKALAEAWNRMKELAKGSGDK